MRDTENRNTSNIDQFKFSHVQGAAEKSSPYSFSLFSQQPFSILI